MEHNWSNIGDLCQAKSRDNTKFNAGEYKFNRRCRDEVEVGPIRNHQHAKRVAAKYIKKNPQYMWTGDWSITVPSQMSVIYVKPRAEVNASLTEDVGVDPTWNQELGDEIAR